ncbi:hypothetical protein TALC_01050 [Thermoplasmatales archaeon BRNA1]|nr:hypothetical protein TALC_01050 [Thermoplasmatales archaeon BRNA1]
MSEIKCPHCGTVFQIDENDYSKIVSQVRDAEFSKEMEFRVQHYEREKEDAISLTKAEGERIHAELLNKTREQLTCEINSRDRQIADLKAKIDQFELEKSMAVKKVEDAKDREIADLVAKQSNWENEKRLALSEAEKEKIEQINSKDREIDDLRHQMDQEKITKKIEQENMKNLYEAQLKAKDDEVEFYTDRHPDPHFPEDEDDMGGMFRFEKVM